MQSCALCCLFILQKWAGLDRRMFLPITEQNISLCLAMMLTLSSVPPEPDSTVPWYHVMSAHAWHQVTSVNAWHRHQQLGVGTPDNSTSHSTYMYTYIVHPRGGSRNSAWGRDGERFARAYNRGLGWAEPPAGRPLKLKDIHFFDALRRAKFRLLSSFDLHAFLTCIRYFGWDNDFENYFHFKSVRKWIWFENGGCDFKSL